MLEYFLIPLALVGYEMIDSQLSSHIQRALVEQLLNIRLLYHSLYLAPSASPRL